MNTADWKKATAFIIEYQRRSSGKIDKSLQACMALASYELPMQRKDRIIKEAEAYLQCLRMTQKGLNLQMPVMCFIKRADRITTLKNPEELSTVVLLPSRGDRKQYSCPLDKMIRKP